MKQNRFDRNGRQSYSSVEQSIPYISGLHSRPEACIRGGVKSGAKWPPLAAKDCVKYLKMFIRP